MQNFCSLGCKNCFAVMPTKKLGAEGEHQIKFLELYFI